MIKTFEHANAVQQRRVDSGRRGFAGAVLRFLKRSEQYGPMKADLPVRW